MVTPCHQKNCQLNLDVQLRIGAVKERRGRKIFLVLYLFLKVNSLCSLFLQWLMMSKILVAPLEALTDPELTDQERRVLFALFSYRGKVTDLVWPTREQLGERANIKDLVRVGKVTSSLCKKGWLVKWKKGFSGHMTYKITFPGRLETVEDAVGQHDTLQDTPLEADYASSLEADNASHSRQIMPSALNKPNKQTNNMYKKIDLTQFGDDCLIDQYKEFIDHRINLKAPLTQHSFERFLFAVRGCVSQLDLDPKFVITETIDAGWKSCKPEWMSNRLAKNKRTVNKNNPDSIRGKSVIDNLTDRGWAYEA